MSNINTTDSVAAVNAKRLEDYFALFDSESCKGDKRDDWDIRVQEPFLELYHPDLIYEQPGRSTLNFKEWQFVARTVYESGAVTKVTKIDVENSDEHESAIMMYGDIFLPDGFKGNLDRKFFFKDGKVTKAVPTHPEVLQQLADHSIGKYFYVPG